MSLLSLPRYLPTRRWRGSRACGPRTAALTSYRERGQRSHPAGSQCRAPPAFPRDRLHYEQHGAAATLRGAAPAPEEHTGDFSSPARLVW